MYRAGRGSVRSPHTLSHAGQQPLQRLRSELVSAEPEVPDDTSASARVDTPAPQLVRPRVVRQRVQLDLRLQPHLLRERSVSRNELQRPRRHLVLLKHLSLEVVPHHPRVHKRRRQTHRLRKPLHRLASRRQALCQILHRRHVACVLCCAAFSASPSVQHQCLAPSATLSFQTSCVSHFSCRHSRLSPRAPFLAHTRARQRRQGKWQACTARHRPKILVFASIGRFGLFAELSSTACPCNGLIFARFYWPAFSLATAPCC